MSNPLQAMENNMKNSPSFSPYRKYVGSLFTILIITSMLFSSMMYNPAMESDAMTLLKTQYTDMMARFATLPLSTPHNLESNPRILILQHAPDLRPLTQASIGTHKLYAAKYNYDYFSDMNEYLSPGTRGIERSNNKLYVVRNALERELSKGQESADWIFWSDVDTLVIDHSIPMHRLLPPPNLIPEPHILASQDQNGLNAGILLIHINPSTLSLFQNLTSTWETLISSGRPRNPTSDQKLLSRALKSNAEHASHFYEIPQVWFNSYDYMRGFELGSDTVRMQIHLVNKLKWKVDFMGLLSQSLDWMEEVGVVVDEVRWEQVEEVGKAWWRVAKAGIEDVRFCPGRC